MGWGRLLAKGMGMAMAGGLSAPRPCRCCCAGDPCSLFKHVSNDPVACCCCCCCCYLSCFFFFLLYLYMHMPMSMPFSACTTLGLWWNRFTFPPYSACALHFWSVSLSWRGKPGMATLGNRLQPWLSSEDGAGTSVGSGGNLSSHPKTMSGFLISLHVFWIFPFIFLYSF